MFALCDRFGLLNVFFTLTPDDECSWRVRLYAMSGKEHEMPSLDCEERDCIVDFKIRKRSRMMYPGACSIEYQSIVQILLEVLFGWDSKKQEGSCGILGTLDAYAVAHEEQGRKTLHGHWLLWIRHLSKIRAMLFHHNKETQRKAREEYSKYIQAVISGTYGELHVLHNCGEKAASLQPQEPVAVEDEDITSLNNNTNINSNSNDSNGCIIEKRASDVFFDWDPTSSLSQQKIDLQRIRNTRNKNKKDEINGEIIHCKTCDAMFTTQDLIMVALKYHRKHSADNDDDITLPILKERQDMAAYLYPYDYLRMLDNQRNEDAMSLLHFANSSASSGVQVNSQCHS